MILASSSFLRGGPEFFLCPSLAPWFKTARTSFLEILRDSDPHSRTLYSSDFSTQVELQVDTQRTQKRAIILDDDFHTAVLHSCFTQLIHTANSTVYYCLACKAVI